MLFTKYQLIELYYRFVIIIIRKNKNKIFGKLFIHIINLLSSKDSKLKIFVIILLIITKNLIMYLIWHTLQILLLYIIHQFALFKLIFIFIRILYFYSLFDHIKMNIKCYYFLSFILLMIIIIINNAFFLFSLHHKTCFQLMQIILFLFFSPCH
jgi:hypothetical protein